MKRVMASLATAVVLFLSVTVAFAGVLERVSIDSAGNQGNGFSQRPAINADGRFVAFYSEANNLVPNDTNETIDVFVHD